MMDRATLAFYDANAGRYEAGPGTAPSPHLDAFVDRLAPGAQVLELGCGSGRDALHMIQRGLRVDATDGSRAMVNRAGQTLGRRVRLLRFHELDAEAAYDAVLASACLIHVARAGLPDVLARIHRALRPAGWHFASYKLGESEGRCRHGRLHNFPDRSWIEGAYREAGLTVVKSEVFRGAGADGTTRDWTAITLRKSN